MPIALVTGGAIRVGAAITRALAQAGFDVVVHTRRAAGDVAALASDVSAAGRRCIVASSDLATDAGVRELASRVMTHTTTLDLLVNNAAAYEHLAFEEVTPAAFDRMFAVNVRAPFFLTQALLPLLRAGGGGAIVNVTDMAVSHAYTTTHFFPHYLASKAALDQLTRAWALELGPAVRVNAVGPGPVAMAGETTDEQRRDMLRRVPLRREGTPEDVARAVVFLAQSSYVTGQTLRVDGGLSVA